MEIFEKLIKDLQKIVYEYLPYEIEGEYKINYYLHYDEENAKEYETLKDTHVAASQYFLFSSSFLL